ncbi:penicillin acylase family protein [Humibacillus xanthopallidus]|uniref:Penicillin amidase n=1 Tax=Humibacillus xanthopallidus TaxID=412689 RepID=A0A543HG36_9MICO|nr:penicillin acylase family protein [Humibacillus xanthopallidus]TQM57253.1 penicillin amidase [Humibacillus xanthopallidus]
MSWRVDRDAHGIPHLRADDVLELARAQGHVTALDRGWQIEHQRWRMEGRTAEHVGASGVPWDTFARQVRLEPTVRAAYDALDEETRAWLQAYVAGVDEGLPEGLARSREIGLLGLEAVAAEPRPWEPWTPLGIFWAIHLLFGTFPYKLFNGHVADTVGPHLLPLINAEGLDGREGVEQSGSNAWVIGGRQTASGLPLVAGDPHRTVELPGCYQQVGLACSEFDVVGFTFPGVPGVQHFAHTGSVAWGITNAMADYQDLTIESLRVAPASVGGTAGGRPLEARGVDGWEPVTRSVETVTVRGGAPVEVPVVVTARGPVVTGVAEAVAAAEAAEAVTAVAAVAAVAVAEVRPTAYSLRTPSQVDHDLGFGALLPLLRARTVDDVEQALSRWVEPVNSALVADTTGRMRHLVVGRVAERDPLNLERPVAAWDPRHVWRGRRPNEVRDIDDVMVSANDRASGGGLGVEYATPFRANRIRELIGEREGLTADDCADIHVDTLNGQAAVMRELVDALADECLTAGGRAVRSELLAWDGRSDPSSHGAALFSAWRTALVRWFTAQPQLAALQRPTGHSRIFASWLDVDGQVGAGWHSLVRGAPQIGIDVAAGACEALDRVAAEVGPDEVWGDRHRLDPLHQLDGATSPDGIPLRGVPSVAPDPVPGDKGCVLAASSAPGVTERAYGGPVARYVWDLADRDASRWVVPFGTSGVPDDPHFADQTVAWLTGRLLPVARDRRA